MSVETLLLGLKELAEGRRTLPEWERFYQQHLAELEASFSRSRCRMLQLRPLSIAPTLLAEYDMSCSQKQFQCWPCGSLLFRVMPGETTEAEILEFASRAGFLKRGYRIGQNAIPREQELDPGRSERILKTGWMAPGLYCPKGCSEILWRIPCELTPAEALLREQERVEEDERDRIEAERSRRENALFRARWEGKVCAQCGQSVLTWGDMSAGCCGYCRHPLDVSPEA